MEKKLSKNKFVSSIQSSDVTVILYPYLFSKSNVLASILTYPDFLRKSMSLLVQNKDEVNAASGCILPENIYSSYENNAVLLEIFEKSSYLIVDSIPLFRLTDIGSVLKKRESSNAKVIFLATLGILPIDIDHIKNIFGKINFLTLQIGETYPYLEYHLHETTMKKSQDQLYQKAREEEIQKHSQMNIRNNYNFETKLDKICNFIYPDSSNMSPKLSLDQLSQSYDLNLNQSNLKMGNKIQCKKYPDIDKNQGGWLSSDILGELSPKLKNLLTLLLTNYEEKHIIFTKYIDHYGIDLISTLLYYLDIPHLTIASSRDNIIERITKYATFSNDSLRQARVLITDVVPRTNVLNIENIHFLEGIDEFILQGFLRNVYAKKSFTHVFQKFKVHFHVARSRNVEVTKCKTPDSQNYEKICSYLDSRQLFFDELHRSASLLSFDPELHFIVA